MTEALDIMGAVQGDGTPTADDGWKIENDQQADWAIRRIQQADTEVERWTAYYSDMIAKVRQDAERTRSYMTAKLEEYFRTVPHKVTRTQERYELPSGKLVLKQGGKVYTHDDAGLLEWARANDMAELIKVSESIRWADLKKRLVVTDDGAVCDSETGLIMGDLVKVTEGEPEFTIMK